MKRFTLTLAPALALLVMMGTHFLALGEPKHPNGVGTRPQDTGAPHGSRVNLNVYFINMENTYLVAENKVLPQNLRGIERGKFIIDEIIKGPQGGLSRSVPENAVLRSFFIDHQKTAYIDLQVDLAAFPGGCLTEYLIIYSVVNSIVLNLPEVTSARILINGKDVTTLAGHIDARRPFKANMLIIR